MARPTRCRRICSEPEFDSFSPGGTEGREAVILTVDEFEAVRLMDYEKKTHEQCAELMGISRTKANTHKELSQVLIERLCRVWLYTAFLLT